MDLKEITAREAALDFKENVWPHLFKGARGGRNAEASRVRAFINAVEKGTETEVWTSRILKQYGGNRYLITTKFEIEK